MIILFYLYFSLNVLLHISFISGFATRAMSSIIG
jgi:hypothetical protein